ncbi:similar to novel protein (predicted), isoform CRA_c [Rattus norvegicus]|uniref:Similar to novel protein (Predicted), isoform CRA_c n=1 Tax=Rattus norvegicus TaxID=10116 RepID=A6KFV2_RAT|nr:similar to novel protein (predicted), isoform CRA_c [Rattus norvegicus]
MSSGVPLLKALLLLLGTGRAQVLATGKSAGTEIDFKYVVIGTALGVALSAGFLALKICMIRRHLSDNDSTDLKNTPQGAILLKEKSLRCRCRSCASFYNNTVSMSIKPHPNMAHGLSQDSFLLSTVGL